MFSDAVVMRSCSSCGETETIPNREGFMVCKRCGCILDTLNLGPPSYNALTNQSNSYGHSMRDKFTRTQIGTSLERERTKFRALEVQQVRAFTTYEGKTDLEAKHEITRFCYNLNLPDSFTQDLKKIFRAVWEKTQKHTVQRNIYAFIPVVVYRCAQLFGYYLPIKQIIPELKVTPKRFRNVLISTYHLFGRVSHYRNCIRVIKEICNRLNTPPQVFITAMKIFSKEKRELMLSISNVAASAAVGMAVIALKQRRSYPLMMVCDKNCSQAAVTSRIFQIALKRQLRIRKYKIYELDALLPNYYKKLIESTERFSSPLIRDAVKNIHRIANELGMPYKLKKRAVKLLQSNKHIFLMTTREVCASSVVGLAVLTFGKRDKFPMYRIAKVLDCSTSSISARIFKVLQSRWLITPYKISYLNKILPGCYKHLLSRI